MNITFTKDTPVYLHSAVYAREHEELPLYRESYLANVACKEAIEKAVSNHYANNHVVVKASLEEVGSGFSMERL